MTDLFQTMRIFSPQSVRVVADVEWTVTTKHIAADLIEIEDGEDDAINHPVNISHADFAEWLEKKEYLEWEHNTSDTVSGEHIQHTGKIGYIDYLRENLTAETIHEYLFDTGRTELAFDRSAL